MPRFPGQTPPIPPPRTTPRKPPPLEMHELEEEPDTGEFPIPRRVKRYVRKTSWVLAAAQVIGAVSTAFGAAAWLKHDIREYVRDKDEPWRVETTMRLTAIEQRLPPPGSVVYLQAGPPVPLPPLPRDAGR